MSAAIENVRIVGRTATQATLAYTAPDDAPCTVEVSEKQNLNPLVFDVDRDKFENANGDNRAGNIVSGRQRTFVIGKRSADVARDGKRYSRALQAFTQHYYRIRCGSSEATGSFETTNIPLGATYSDPLPSDPAKPGTYAYPTIDFSDIGKDYIDPQTGALLKRASGPEIVPDLAASEQNFDAVIALDAAWNNAVSAQSNKTGAAAATYTSNGAQPGVLLFRFANFTFDDNLGAYYGREGTSLDWIQAHIRASIARPGCNSNSAADDCKIQVCLTINSVDCATPWKDVALGNAMNVQTVGSRRPIDTWAPEPIHRAEMATRKGTLTVGEDGATATWASGARFNPNWKKGSRIQLLANMSDVKVALDGGGALIPNDYSLKIVAVFAGGGVSAPTGDLRVNLLPASTAANLSWAPVPGAVSYRIFWSVAGQKYTNGYFVTETNTFRFENLNNTRSGALPETVAAECAIEGIDPSNGNLLKLDRACLVSTGLPYPLAYSFSAPNFGVLLRKKTATADTLSVAWVGYSYGASGTYSFKTSGGQRACSPVPVAANEYLCRFIRISGGQVFLIDTAAGSARILSDMVIPAKDDGANRWRAQGNYGVYALFHPENPRIHYGLIYDRRGSAIAYQMTLKEEAFRSPLNRGRGEASCQSLGRGLDDFGFDCDQTQWKVLTPSSSGMSIADQLGIFTGGQFERDRFTAHYITGVQFYNGETYLTGESDVQQDFRAWIWALAIGDGDPRHAGQSGGPRIVAATPTWRGIRWAMNHGSLGVLGGGENSRFISLATNFAGGLNPRFGGGPFLVRLAQDSTLNDTDTQTTIELDPQANEPYDPDPAPGESGAPGALDIARPGDLFAVSDNFNSAARGEVVRLVSKNSPTNWTVQRAVSSYPPKRAIMSGTIYLWAMPNGAVIQDSDNPYSGGLFWDFIGDPHGRNATGATIFRDPQAGIGHSAYDRQVYTQGGSFDSNIGCPVVNGSSSCHQIREGPISEMLTAHKVFVYRNSGFAGGLGTNTGNLFQTHVAPPPLATKDKFVGDGAPFMGFGTPAAWVSGSLWKLAGTLINGSKDDIDLLNGFVRLNRKKMPTLAACGFHPMVDISGPNTIISDNESDYYKYFVVRNPGEGRPDSKPGEVYMNCPYVTRSTCLGDSANTFSNWNDVTSPCIGNNPALGHTISQFGYERESRKGELARPITTGFSTYAITSPYWHPQFSPDGKWAFSAQMNFGGARSELTMVKLPPFPDTNPAAPENQVDRGTFIPVRLNIAEIPGEAARVLAKFGYAEFGQPFDGYCTSRRERCYAVSDRIDLADPFRFESELDTNIGVPCTLGCQFVIPAIPQRVLYYQLIYTNSSGQVVAVTPGVAAVE